MSSKARDEQFAPVRLNDGYVDEGEGLESGYHGEDADSGDNAPEFPEASPLEVLRYLRSRDLRSNDRRDD